MGVINPGGGAATLPAGLGADRLPGLVAPFNPIAAYGTSTTSFGFLIGQRIVIPKAGVLHDLAVFIATAAGNIRGGVYDTGDASAGNRTLLWDSGTIAVGGTGWLALGDPALNVSSGQALDLAVTTSVNTCAIAAMASIPAGGLPHLPANLLPTPGGASPYLAWYSALAFGALPATVADASLNPPGAALAIVARVA